MDDVFSSDTEDEATGAVKARARVERGEALKAEGNRLLQAGSAAEAAAAYGRALKAVWALYRQRKDAGAVRLGAALDLNLALCHLRLEAWEAARRSASRALEADGGSAKGLYRRGVAAARLGLLDAAESDLAAAVSMQAGAEAKRELADVRARLASLKPSGRAVVKGFLQCGESEPKAVDGQQDGKEAASLGSSEVNEPAEVTRNDENVTSNESAEEKEVHDDGGPEWVAGVEVLSALEEVNSYLSAIAQRRILCESTAQLDAISEQLDLVSSLLPGARAAVDLAVVDDRLPEEPCGGATAAEGLEIEPLLEKMADGLCSFRPFFQLQERSPGEFDSLRACRELPGAAGRAFRGFDVELVRWGDAGPATQEDFAAPLFPPTGRPPDAAAATWQFQVFHRVFQKDASKYVAGAAWLLLSELLRGRRRPLLLSGRRVLELGLAHGHFFAAAAAEGPALPGAAAGGEADGLAVCAGKDRRLVLVPSFTSLGVVHKWLLVAVEGADGGPREEFAVDLCSGALGLLEGPGRKMVRVWPAAGDQRFLVRCACWGPEALLVAQGSASAGAKSADLQASAMKALATAAGLPAAAAPEAGAPPPAAGEPAGRRAEAARAEAARRLRGAAGRLGLPLGQAEVEEEAPDDGALDAMARAAVEELARRRLRKAGLAK